MKHIYQVSDKGEHTIYWYCATSLEEAKRLHDDEIVDWDDEDITSINIWKECPDDEEIELYEENDDEESGEDYKNIKSTNKQWAEQNEVGLLWCTNWY